MKKIIKVYKKDCRPCQELSEALAEVAVDNEFELIEYDITSTDFTERKKGKGLLMKYAATIPFLVFEDEQGAEYAAHYNEAGPATPEIIISKLKQ